MKPESVEERKARKRPAKFDENGRAHGKECYEAEGTSEKLRINRIMECMKMYKGHAK